MGIGLQTSFFGLCRFGDDRVKFEDSLLSRVIVKINKESIDRYLRFDILGSRWLFQLGLHNHHFSEDILNELFEITFVLKEKMCLSSMMYKSASVREIPCLGITQFSGVPEYHNPIS